MTKTTFLAAALLLCGLAVASAQTAPVEPPPVADQGSTVQAKCIEENSDFKMSGKHPAFVVELENKCEQRMKCRVDVNVSSAKGAAQGHETLMLGPKSSGAGSKKSYTLKVKMMGGMAQSSRSCQAI